MKYTKLQATLTGISTRSDRSVGVRFVTQELSDDEKLTLFNLQNSFGWLLYAPEDVKEIEIPTEPVEDKTKTPSKRLRGVLFKLHVQTGGGKENFEQFYRTKLEQIIDHYKGKLDL